MSDPGPHAAAFDALPDDVPSLCRLVQGVLLHDHYGGELYGNAPPEFFEQSRATPPVAEKLSVILERDPTPLDRPRPPFERAVGTCRDFALMLCAMLRHKGSPARVRCGFADYFGGHGWEDHWVCEVWQAGEGRWALADAQLDDAHRRHLGIDFDTADMPREHFLLAPKAWRACRSGADPARFGHGEATGLWLVEVNLARDLFALAKHETSPWDTWRASPASCRRLDTARLARGDRWAALAEADAGLPAWDQDAPPWSAGE
jgi:hypothetical protein